ncbi:nuclear transport factor 2 family protein [Acinetobacter sp. 3657]|uniref:nuclear transport factor 2 family protein n=1 Tax=Acinetobacter sp. 3657 TaxID=2817764 RepID=UPI002866F7FE|nr:ketosteroid isomerase-like protein [Prolinoborus sp. 3657]
MNSKELIQIAKDTKKPKDVVTAFLANTGKDTIIEVSEALVDINATYISLSFNNPELKQIEPWAGTSKGRQVYIDTFSNVGTYWNVDDFQVTDLISENETVAVFGSFTYTSVEVGHQFTSPFSILAKVQNGLITYFQFMEDTYASARSFRSSGKWTIKNNSHERSVG